MPDTEHDLGVTGSPLKWIAGHVFTDHIAVAITGNEELAVDQFVGDGEHDVFVDGFLDVARLEILCAVKIGTAVHPASHLAFAIDDAVKDVAVDGVERDDGAGPDSGADLLHDHPGDERLVGNGRPGVFADFAVGDGPCVGSTAGATDIEFAVYNLGILLQQQLGKVAGQVLQLGVAFKGPVADEVFVGIDRRIGRVVRVGAVSHFLAVLDEVSIGIRVERIGAGVSCADELAGVCLDAVGETVVVRVG